MGRSSLHTFSAANMAANMFSKRLWRLRTYLYLLAFGILLPAVLLTVWNGYSQYRQAEEAAEREVYTLANIGAETTALFLADAETLLKGLSTRIQSRPLPENGCDPIFEEFKTLFPQFSNLSQSTPEGYIVCSSMQQPGNNKTYVGDKEWFKQVYNKGRFIVGPPYKGPVTGRMVSVLAYPLRNKDGKMTGALQLPIDLVNYELIPGSGKLPKTINVSIFDSSGVIIARSQKPEKFIGKSLRGLESVEHFLRAKDGTTKSVSSEGVERIFGFRPIPGTDWFIVAGIATSEALKGSRTTARNNAILGFVGLGLAMGIAFFMSRLISKPITDLQDTAARIVLGEHERRAYVHGPKELLDVTRQFNTMLDAIDQARKAQVAREAEVHRLAFYDVLTGLPNRRLLVQKIDELCKTGRDTNRIGAILYIDLDHFKDINDAYGHQAGDRFLKAVSQRLSRFLNDDDIVARIGGDEFVYITAFLASSQEDAASAALKFGARIQRELQQPSNDEGSGTTSSASVGITLFPKIGDTSEILLHEADIAMYQAKQGGRNAVVLFESAMRQQITQRLAMEADLQYATTNGDLTLHVQSQVNHAGEVTGVEALVRWHHPERGLIPPDTFIPLAERSSLIIEIGRWVLHEGCKAQISAHATYPGVPLSVNVSPRQFHHPGFIDDVRDAIACTNANPELLILEVTEGVLIEDIEHTIQRMSELAEIGIRFSIDDFGTGYSSLSYLKRLPLYELKIDKSFIKDTPADSNDTAIVTSIVGVAKHLQLHVVAEGVETQAQVDFLKAIGCDAMQGYLFARPMSVPAWLEGAKPRFVVSNQVYSN